MRIQFTTDVLNERSRQAILRLGASQDGIIDDEWPTIKERLTARLACGRADTASLNPAGFQT